jgi:predicted ArsR family transcriptional regulator
VDVTDTDGSDGSPPFVDVFASGDAEQRVYEAILQSRDPTSARATAETTDCAPKTARKHLDWFTQLGIVT